MQWFLNNWQNILLGLLGIETALSRLFPNVGFLKTADTDLKAIAQATGVKQ